MLSPEQFTQAVRRAIQTNVCILSPDLPPAFCPTVVHPQITSLIYWDRKDFTRTPQLTTQQLKLSVSDPSWAIPAHTSDAHSITPVLLNYYTWNTSRSKTFCFYQTTTFHKKKEYIHRLSLIWMNLHIFVSVNTTVFQ